MKRKLIGFYKRNCYILEEYHRDELLHRLELSGRTTSETNTVWTSNVSYYPRIGETCLGYQRRYETILFPVVTD